MIETERTFLLKSNIEMLESLVEDKHLFHNRVFLNAHPSWLSQTTYKEILNIISVASLGYDECYMPWLVAMKDSLEIVGDISLTRDTEYQNVLNLGYAIAKPYRNHHIMREALYALMNIIKECDGFAGLKFIYAKIHRDNIASQRCIESVGFKLDIENSFETLLYKYPLQDYKN